MFSVSLMLDICLLRYTSQAGRSTVWGYSIMFLALSTIAFSVTPYYILFAVAFPNHSLFELGASCTDWKPSRETGVVFPLSSRQ
jgi:hypothetical protein